MSSSPSSSRASSSPYPDALNNRVNFKLNAARMHLDNLHQLEINGGGSLASSNVRMQAEIEIDELFYHLVGVKDALLQEINRDLLLGLAPEDVKEETINSKLEEKLGEDAKDDLMCRINMMKSGERHPLRRINEMHNHSKHRNMLAKHIGVSVPDGETNFVFIDPPRQKVIINQ